MKRGKLFAQVKKFNDVKKHEGCWVDTNTGKILLKVASTTRGRVIRNTFDLVEIDDTFLPEEWYFCCPPNFSPHDDRSSPSTLSNLTIPPDFSPVPPNRFSTPNRSSRRGGYRPDVHGMPRGQNYR